MPQILESNEILLDINQSDNQAKNFFIEIYRSAVIYQFNQTSNMLSKKKRLVSWRIIQDPDPDQYILCLNRTELTGRVTCVLGQIRI